MNARRPEPRVRWLALTVGALALGACLLLGRNSPRQAQLSYLVAFVFFTGLSVGSQALAMIHVLTGGAWGYHIRPPLLAAAQVLPLQAVLAIPFLLGVRVLYPWADAAAIAQDAVLRSQSWYLNPTFFEIRTVVYFVVWWLLLWRFRRNLQQPEYLPGVAAPGLIAYTLTGTLAAIDWIMSLSLHWHSTVFGMMVFTGWLLAGAALATACVTMVTVSTERPPPQVLHDLGNLLLALVLGWSYLAFMQYLTVWIADLPMETSWYIPRTLTSWRMLAWFLIAFHFAVPFAVLLSRRAKRHRIWLGCIASLLLVANLADALWLVVPEYRPHGLALQSTDLLAPLGMGALWLYVFLGRLRADPLRGHTPRLRMSQMRRADG